MAGIGWPELIVMSVIGFILISSVISWLKDRSKSKQKNNLKQPIPYKRKKGKGHDIFLSYASPDRTTAKAISKALKSLGWAVWWDRSIPPGKSFDQVIEAAIDSASCIVVLWSKSSVNSEWVKNEASEGVRRQILVPGLIEDVKIPLEFRRIQAADLIEWKSSTSHSGFQSMASSIASLLNK